MTCLLDAERLRSIGIDIVPHGERGTVYEKLLQGIPFRPQQRPDRMLLDVEAEPGQARRANGGNARPRCWPKTCAGSSARWQ